MGNLMSKCCGRGGRKYAGDDRIGKATQPEQNGPSINVATNKGVAYEIPNTIKKEEKRDGKEEETVDDDKDKVGDGSKKSGRKHRRRKPSESEDSSDFWTSSSSDSSESESDDRHSKSNRKVYKNKGGSTTIISKKTIMTGNKMSIGKNSRNITINIGSNTNTPTVNGNFQEKSEERHFQSYYSASKAKEEEKRQYASPWGEGMRPPPGGNFIDTRDYHVKDFVFESSVRVDAARWVCMICSPAGTGTGFRVGSKYIMTAGHVVKTILDPGYLPVGQSEQNPYSGLQAPGVYAVFGFMTEGQQIPERQKFRFKDIVHFIDDATDTAVLELEDNTTGAPMPLSFTYFSLPKLNDRFSFIGHPEGKRMQINYVEKIIDINSTQTQRDIVAVKQLSLHHAARDYEFPPHHVLTNPNRYLFHCKFSKGASGSPGVVVLDDGRIVVVTMLLCGLPDWFYDRGVSDHLKNTWSKNECVEQGVNFKSVHERMSRDNPRLCSEIFFDPTDSIPNPNL